MSEGPPNSVEQGETPEALRAANEALHKEIEVLKAELSAALAAAQEVEQKLVEAGIDKVTNLPTRERFESIVTALVAHPLGPGERPRKNLPKRLALLFADVDKFKLVNDTYGHSKGDEVLRAIADELADGIRPADYIGRWGGEEIVIVLTDATGAEAVGRATHLLQRVAGRHFRGVDQETGEQRDFTVTVSIGTASMLNNSETSFEELVSMADKAMYIAKDTGRNRVVGAPVVPPL